MEDPDSRYGWMQFVAFVHLRLGTGIFARSRSRGKRVMAEVVHVAWRSFYRPEMSQFVFAVC